MCVGPAAYPCQLLGEKLMHHVYNSAALLHHDTMLDLLTLSLCLTSLAFGRLQTHSGNGYCPIHELPASLT